MQLVSELWRGRDQAVEFLEIISCNSKKGKAIVNKIPNFLSFIVNKSNPITRNIENNYSTIVKGLQSEFLYCLLS